MSGRHPGPFGIHGHLHAHARTARDLLHHRQFSSPPLHLEESLRNYLEMLPLPGGLTVTSLRQAMAGVSAAAASQWVGPLNAACTRFQITQSVRRMAAFLGHVAHESGGLHNVREYMGYRTDQMLKTFHRFFKTAADTEPYLNNQEALANKVYANRMGNGDSASGDGWKYRGRGLIQLTGKDNYKALTKDLNVDFVKDPDLVATPQYAALSAAWFWKKHGLNGLADAQHYQALSKRINNSLDSFPAREAKRKRALDTLCRVALTNITLALMNRGFQGF